MLLLKKSHKNLKVWREAITLAKLIYELTDKFPESERYGLSSQLRRSSVSIASNIAEGAARIGEKDSLHFWIIARGSITELDTQLELCKALGFLNSAAGEPVNLQIKTVDSLLSGLIRYKRHKMRS